MLSKHLHILLHRVSGLLRTRVIISMIGIYVTYSKPEIGQSICILVGLALGVSAIDALKGNKSPQESSDNERP